MKTMKTMLSVLLGIALIFSFAGVGAAEDYKGLDVDEDTSVSETITATLSVGMVGDYEVSIPSGITVYEIGEVDYTIWNEFYVNLAEDFPDNKAVNLTISSEEGWVLEHETNLEVKLPYQLYICDITDIGEEYYNPVLDQANKITVNSAETGMNVLSSFNGNIVHVGIVGEALEEVTESGNYLDRLTFTVQVVDYTPVLEEEEEA